MTSPAEFLGPPRAAAWLVNLFTPVGESESILGDLVEEFSGLASQSGIAAAQNWYWRQVVNTIAHLVRDGFRRAPWSTTWAAVGGFLLMRIGLQLSSAGIEAVLDRYQVWELHFAGYRPWIWVTGGLQHILVAMAAGVIVAMVAKGREMTATLALSLFPITLAVSGSLIGIARTSGDYGFLWMLPWQLASALAAVVGGAIVRLNKRPESAGTAAR